jgi:hypothetical protein
MLNRGALTDLVRRGRRRQACYFLVAAASQGTVVALGGAVFLLLVGTEIFHWYWLVLLFAAGLYRSRIRLLSGYQITQEIDRRLELQDALSTAYYFAAHPDRSASPRELVESQKQTAEELARSADLGRGLPFRAPRTLYVNAALAVLACGVFGLRYGVERNLDLRPSLVRIAFDSFRSPRNIAEVKNGVRPPDEQKEQGFTGDPANSKSENAATTQDQMKGSSTIDDPSVNNPNRGADSRGQKKESPNEAKDAEENASGSPEKKDPAAASHENGGESPTSPDGNSKADRQQDGGQDSNRAGDQSDSSSLADKLRNALSNLMAKLKTQPKSDQAQQKGGSQSSSAQAGKQRNQTKDGAPQSENSEQADASAGNQSQGEQQQGGTEQAQGKSQGNSADHPNSPDGKNGIGSQEGDKTAREAAEEAAMGKITELIGKRAAKLNGDVMVEVASGKQQLKTQYSAKDGRHADTGGEINRDEIPLAYQQYVQHYFEEIRKTPEPAGRRRPKQPETGEAESGR